MTPLAIGALALGMSVDALVAALGRGAAVRRPGFGMALRTGLVFGLVETVTPLVGWLAGAAASRWVASFDHWIAFVLLGLVGGRMAWNALSRHPEQAAPPPPTGRAGMMVLLATAVGTSIDAMAVGVSLAFLDVNILVIAAAIGLATTVMATGGMLAGRFLGDRFGRLAEIAGGATLVGLGGLILYAHLSAA